MSNFIESLPTIGIKAIPSNDLPRRQADICTADGWMLNMKKYITLDISIVHVMREDRLATMRYFIGLSRATDMYSLNICIRLK